MSLFILLVDDIITLAIRGFGNSTPTWVALPLIRRPRIAPLYESGGLGVSMDMEPVLLGTERGRTPWVAPRGLHLIIYIEHKDNKKKLFLQIPGRKKRKMIIRNYPRRTLKASTLNNRSVRRTCGLKMVSVSTLKECPRPLMVDSFRVDTVMRFFSGGASHRPVIERRRLQRLIRVHADNHLHFNNLSK